MTGYTNIECKKKDTSCSSVVPISRQSMHLGAIEGQKVQEVVKLSRTVEGVEDVHFIGGVAKDIWVCKEL